MNPSEVLRLVDTIHRERNIDKEVVFESIEAALLSTAKKQYGEGDDVNIWIDRESGVISGEHDGIPLTPEDISERIGAQTAKQVMIQKIREAERDSLLHDYLEQSDQLVVGSVHSVAEKAIRINLPKAEGLLPKSEQVSGEVFRAGDRIRGTVCEVRAKGSKVQVVISRNRVHLIRRLFEQEIPEIGDGVIEIKALAREPGSRTKIAVYSEDQRIDCVGACVGVRGSRIKNILDEIGNERIDVVPYSDEMQVFIPNALQPAEVEEVILCQMLGKAIVLVREDQLSLAIGRRGQNVRLASKLCVWDIDIMTREELDEEIEQAVMGFSSLEGMDEELAERLVGEGFLSYDDLSVIEPEDLAEMGGLDMDRVEAIISQAEKMASEAEAQAQEERRRQREEDRREAARVESGDSLANEPGSDAALGNTELSGTDGSA